MKFMHLSDLHLGKRVNEFPMLEDQRYILDRIIDIIDEEKPQAVLIAGDVYDKPVPSGEAVQLFDDFISKLAERELEVMIISGNHDSAERLSFGSRIMSRRGIHLAGGYDGTTHKVTLEDEYGEVDFYLLPFLKPVHVRAAIARELAGSGKEDETDDVPVIATYTDAVRYVIDRMDIDHGKRNVLIAHQFCTGSLRSESEEISVGGLDNVDVDVFDGIDYTALGHLHGPQDTSAERVRYCGSPLKYSFSEVNQVKSVTIIEMGEKKDGVCKVHIETSELIPRRDMRELIGKFSDLSNNDYLKGADKSINTDDYMRIILTDEEDVIGALASLRAIYPNIMRLEYDNTRTRATSIAPDMPDSDSRTPLEIFAGLYESQNGKPMDEDQVILISELIERVWNAD